MSSASASGPAPAMTANAQGIIGAAGLVGLAALL